VQARMPHASARTTRLMVIYPLVHQPHVGFGQSTAAVHRASLSLIEVIPVGPGSRGQPAKDGVGLADGLPPSWLATAAPADSQRVGLSCRPYAHRSCGKQRDS
jgi:hypothetical protein